MASYKVHDNGGRPFRVRVNKHSVAVYQHDDGKKEIWRQNSPLRVFIGEGPCDDERDEGAGNSVLIKIDKHNYVFVGSTIYSFATTDEIESFVSPVGPNDVPYPYAIGTEFVYLLFESVFFPVEQFEPYGLFYGIKPDVTNLTKKVIHGRVLL